jgi:hypothetical protein
MKIVMSVLVVLVSSAEASPLSFEAESYVGGGYNDAMYGSDGSGDVGLSLLGRYGVALAGVEWQYSGIGEGQSHYVGVAAGRTWQLSEHWRFAALATGGYHHISNDFAFELDFGHSSSGETTFNTAYAGGQARIGLVFGHGWGMSLIAHARFDAFRNTVEATQYHCDYFQCTSASEAYRVGGNELGGALGVDYGF